MSVPLSRQRGLTIVELMVSVAISLVVLSSLVYVYVGSRGAYRTNEALARVQESGRFALEWLARDLRQAGYFGCLSRDLPVTMYAYPPPAGIKGFGNAIYGFEKTTTKTGANYAFTPPSDVVHVAGDVVVLSSLVDNAVASVDKDYDTGIPANTKVAFSVCPKFEQGDALVITDCQRAAIFSVTNNPVCTGNTAVLTHASGTKAAGNGWPKGEACPYTNMSCSDDFKFVPPYQKSDRALVARFTERWYFIGRPAGANFADRAPALYRFDSATKTTEAVVENVEDLDLLFGVDTSVPRNGSVDLYLKADQVTDAGQWDRVVSVRVSLVAASGALSVQAGRGDKSAIAPGQVIFLRDEDGDTVVDKAPASTDRQLRQVFTTTVALRNRLP